MARKEKYRSDIARTVHETVRGLHRIGLVDKKTMRRFDASCLTAVFASFLNVRPGLVSQWERGEKKPSGPSLKLLSIIKAKGLDAIA
jgi:putative transcriptional regulator